MATQNCMENECCLNDLGKDLEGCFFSVTQTTSLLGAEDFKSAAMCSVSRPNNISHTISYLSMPLLCVASNIEVEAIYMR